MPVKNRLVELLAAKMQRDKRLISPTEVANRTGMSRQNVHRWLNNEVTSYPSETLDKLCDFLDCDLSELLVRVKDGESEVQVQ